MALSWIYVLYGQAGRPVAGLFFGLKAAVLAVGAEAVLRIGRRALRGPALAGLAAAAFAGASSSSTCPSRSSCWRPGTSAIWAPDRADGLPRRRHGEGRARRGRTLPARRRCDPARSASRPAGRCAWWRPGARPGSCRSPPSSSRSGPATCSARSRCSSPKMALVTFGGAYAVLSYVAQQAVEHYGWLRPGEMLDGLGMAETTPGPLIMVTQFVGFLAAYRAPGRAAAAAAARSGACSPPGSPSRPAFSGSSRAPLTSSACAATGRSRARSRPSPRRWWG